MAKFLFSVLPALGHLSPTIAIASELKKRGHEIGYATGRDMQYAVESEGFRYFQAGPPGMRSDIPESGKKALKFFGIIGNYYFFKLLMDVNWQTIDELKAVARDYQPDVLFVDSLTFAGGEIAELFNLPWATGSAVPGMLPSRDVPPYTHWGLPPSDNLFIKGAYALIRYGQGWFLRLFDYEFNKVRSTLGLGPIKHGLTKTTLSPYLFLIYSCEGFEYKRSDWPAQAHLIGPSPWGRTIDNDHSFDWIEELPKDVPIIYVTLGTFQSYRSLDFFHIVMQACEKEPYHVVMSVGHAVDVEQFKNAPSNFSIEQYIPHSKILPCSSAVVHHGGFGIAQDTIYHGLPSIIVPVGQDLYENARRCTEAGVSMRIPYKKLNPKRLRDAIRFVLQDEQIRENTKRLQKKFLSMNAGKTGADLLERLAETKSPVYRNQ